MERGDRVKPEAAIRSEDEPPTPVGARNESGQTLVEYAMILAFMAAALVASVILLEVGVSGASDDVIAVVESLTS